MLCVAGHTDGVTGGVISDDNRLAATLAYDTTARLWDMDTGACLGVMPHGGAVVRAVFAADSSMLLTAAADHSAIMWDIEPGCNPRFLHILRVGVFCFGLACLLAEEILAVAS